MSTPVNHTGHSPSAANSRSATRISPLPPPLQSPKVHCNVHRARHYHSHSNLIHVSLLPCFCDTSICFQTYIILPSTSRSVKCPILFKSSDQNFVRTSHSSNACHMPRTSVLLDLSNTQCNTHFCTTRVQLQYDLVFSLNSSLSLQYVNYNKYLFHSLQDPSLIKPE
jgi:hypothetical protein